MAPKLYRIIKFKQNCGSCGGSLVQFQEGLELENALPFTIGKVLVSWDMKPDDTRGNHAHHETEEIVVALSGGCTFDLDDGRGTSERVRLSASPEDRDQKSEISIQHLDLGSPTSEKAALLLYPHIWRTFYDFEPGTVLLVVANIKYDEADYIRDRNEFEQFAKNWNGSLGGSSAQSAEAGRWRSEIR
jgi:hypothetical protein